MPKCDFNKVGLQLYWNRISAWMYSCKFPAYYQNTFYKKNPGWLLLTQRQVNIRQNKLPLSLLSLLLGILFNANFASNIVKNFNRYFKFLVYFFLIVTFTTFSNIFLCCWNAPQNNIHLLVFFEISRSWCNTFVM